MTAEEMFQSFHPSFKATVAVMVSNPSLRTVVEAIPWENGVIVFGSEGDESLECVMVFLVLRL